MAKFNLHAMRMGPGKHLMGQELMGEIVKPEEFDYFHEMIITQELARTGKRGYGDGELPSTLSPLCLSPDVLVRSYVWFGYWSATRSQLR